MIFQKISRISRFTEKITVSKLDSILKITPLSHKVYNPYCFCKKQFSIDYHNRRYLNAFSNVRYMHLEAQTSMKDNSAEQQNVGVKLLESLEDYANSVPKRLLFNESLVIDNIEELLGKSWISMSNSEIITNFEFLSHYAYKHQAMIQDDKFHGVIEVLKNRCVDFSDSDIRHLFKCLQLWNIDKSNENFTNLWKAFEDEISTRYSNWTIDEILLTCHLYFLLKISRKSEFTFHSLKKIGRKPQNMNHTQLIHFTFLTKQNRKLPINLYNIEYYVEQQLDKLSISELGIFAIAFSNYETPIRNPVFIEKMIDKLIAEIDTVNESTLNSILNVIRVHKTTKTKYTHLLHKLEEICPSLSLHTLTNIVYLQKKTLMHSETMMSKILERFEKKIRNMKIKQIDQVMISLFTLGYDPNTTPFCSAVLRELLTPRRADELEKYSKLVIEITHNALFMNGFSNELEELCKKIFDPEFIDKSCKNDYYFLNREYLEASYCLELDYPEYNGPKLEQQIIDFLCKSHGSYRNENTTRRSEKSSFDGILLTEVEKTCQKVLKSESLFYRIPVLPHTSKAFGIVCYDPETKEFGSPKEKLSNIPWYLLKYAPNDGRKWFAFVTASVHQIINNTHKPVGKILMQMRHLEKIGYEPIIIPYHEWETLISDSEKEKYILDILHRYNLFELSQ